MVACVMGVAECAGLLLEAGAGAPMGLLLTGYLVTESEPDRMAGQRT